MRGTRNGKQNEIYRLWYCRRHKVILGKFDLPVCSFREGSPKGGGIGPVRESNPGPLAPKARIMPLDQQAGDIKYGLGRVFYSLLLLKRVD